MRTFIGLVVVASACTAATPQATVVGVPITAVSAVATTAPIVREDITAPFSLTATDGSGLVLTRIDAKAVMEGPLAFTELHLWFRNTEARNREGTFQITLPQHAAVSRFAMESEAGQWMEAEVVPKLVARRAYEDFLHRRQDPALLEKAAGNQFTARVFPIFAHAEKHLVISYSQELPGKRYTLPLRGLPRASRVDVEFAQVDSDGKRSVEKLAQRDWVADRDFVSSATTSAAAVGADGLVVAQVEVGGASHRDVPRGITLLVDTSASRALGFERYLKSVQKLVAELRATWGDALPLQIYAFDQDTQLVFDGRIDEAQVKKLVERGAAGASNVGQAMEWIARHGAKSRVVIVGDGVITAGPEGRALQAVVKQLAGVERVDVVLAGGLRDDRAAQTIVRSLPRSGAVLDLETDAVATALGEAVVTHIALDVPGATWMYPRSVPSARAGTKVMVFARMPSVAPVIEVVAGGVKRPLRVLAGTQPLVERAVASAEIEELEASLAKTQGDLAKQVRTKIAQKSVAARVLSRETSMLVLESESDYPRYGIDRKALADVLVVGARGVERVRRSDITRIPTRVATDKPVTTDTVEPRASEPPKPKTTAIRQVGDTDHDAILDVDDRCPSEPESYNAYDDDDGCPDRGRVVMTSTSIMVLEPVHFKHGRDVVHPSSFPILDAVAQTLLASPDIQLIEIQGHTDERGSDADNLALSDRRAAAVRDYLVAKGVAPQRLAPQGYGETQPIDRRHTAQAWAKNRRVDFLILRRDNGNGKSPNLDAPPAVTGELAEIQKAIAAKQLDAALAKARAWQSREPGNVLALVGLGEALEATRAPEAAARAFGSIIDLFPGRADMRRFAGERLMRLANPLAIDTFRRAVADRPDHLTGHRLLAYALVRANQHADGFAAILASLGEHYRETSFNGGRRVLAEDAAMIGAAYANAVPAKRADIVAALAKHKLALATKPSTRFVVYWETDANDVDLHVTDAKGRHASYETPKLPSGGELYADVTNGYGPECFAIEGTPKAGPYQLSLHYYAQGPMGYGMGLLQIQTFDPARGLTFDDRPYLIMTPHAKVDLGTYR